VRWSHGLKSEKFLIKAKLGINSIKQYRPAILFLL
jgi:hypothetical protein